MFSRIVLPMVPSAAVPCLAAPAAAKNEDLASAAA